MNQQQIRKKFNLNKYAYVIDNPWEVRFLYSLGIMCWVLILYGYYKFFISTGNHWYFYIFGPFIILVAAYHFVTYFIKLFVKKFDTSKHEALIADYWSKPVDKSVDIFLPVCNEPESILEETFAAVQKIDYSNKSVYVLDDGHIDSAKNLASKYGFKYLQRPNRGEMKKAGNLKYGFEHSTGEFIVIFDADFVPEPTFVRELLPYTKDESIGIVQSPQYFVVNDALHKLSPIAYGAGHMQQDFYKIMLQARDNFDAIICVGTNAIYRRKALESIGGPAQYDHSEDVHTGLGVISAGYKLRYIPVIQAVGLCPEDSVAFFKQHNRWCSGSVGLFLSGKVFRCKLNLTQIVNYYTGFMYFLSQCVYFILPAQMYYLLFNNFESISFQNAIYFIPNIIFGMIIVPQSRPSPLRLGTYVANISAIYVHTITVILRLLGRAANWVPTNIRNIKIDPIFMTIHIASLIYVVFYIFAAFYTSFAYRLPVLNFNFYTLTFWIYWNIFYHSLFMLSSGFAIYKSHLARLFERHSINDPVKSGVEHPLFAYRYILFFPITVLSVLTIVSSRNSLVYETMIARNTKLQQLAKAASSSRGAAMEAKSDSSTTKTETTIDNGSVAGARTSYSYTATPGDSLTAIVARFVSEYTTASGVTLLPYQKTFLETQLIFARGERNLQLGETVIFTPAEFDSLLARARSMQEYEVKYWSELGGTSL